jgi:hypothetical protein
MGHDIQIINEDGHVETVFYISYNFSAIAKKYGGEVFRMHGHSGITVSKICTKVINKMIYDGVSLVLPDPDNHNWYWGVKDGVEMPDKEFKEVYLFHINFLRTLAEVFSKCHFYSDSINYVTYYEDSEEDYQSGGEDLENAISD